jgi:CheY-like chemotaxis protein
LIVCDIGLPDADGYQLPRRVQSRYPAARVPMIALTAHVGPDDRQRALLAGFDLHLSKPVDPGRLVDAALDLLGRELTPFEDEPATSRPSAPSRRLARALG